MCLGYLQVDDQADGRTSGRPLATTEEKEWPTKIYNIEPWKYEKKKPEHHGS